MLLGSTGREVGAAGAVVVSVRGSAEAGRGAGSDGLDVSTRVNFPSL